MVLSTPRPRGRGKRRPERGEGAAKRPRMEESSSDRRDGSEESRSGGGRDRPGRCSQSAAGPSTPPRRPIPASVSPRRSPRLSKSAVQDLRSLPPTTKSGRRTAHPRSVSGDERGRGPSRSSLSSSDHGRLSQGWRSRPRRHQLEEPSRRKWWPRPATPLSRRGTQPPLPCGPRAAGAQQRTSQQGRERPESWQNLLPRSGSWRRRPDHRGTDERERGMGPTGPWTHENAEWLSAMLGKCWNQELDRPDLSPQSQRILY